MRRAAILSLLAFLAAAGGAQAHAFLDHAEPRVGSTVSAAPSVVSLWFTQNIEHAFTTVEVLDSSGTRVSVGKPRIDTANSLMQISLKIVV